MQIFMYENEFEHLLEKLFSHFKVADNVQLAKKLGVTRQNIANWKARNSVNAIKKKCRELGIYNEIFGDIQTNNFQNSTNQVGQNFGDKNKIITSSQSDECNQIDKMDKTIVQSFIDVYLKLDKTNELKKLYDLLGDLKYS